MSIFLMSQEFGGNGSARIRVRIKAFKPTTFPKLNLPSKPIVWPSLIPNYQAWRCECGSTGACGHVMLRNQITCGGG